MPRFRNEKGVFASDDPLIRNPKPVRFRQSLMPIWERIPKVERAMLFREACEKAMLKWNEENPPQIDEDEDIA